MTEKKGAKSTPNTVDIVDIIPQNREGSKLFNVLSSACEDFCEPLFLLTTFDAGTKGYPCRWTGINTIPEDTNIYYGINPRASMPVTGQGKKDDISFVVAFFADIDVGVEGHRKESTFETIEEAKARLEKFYLKPSFLVFSGHGLQALWILTEAQEIGKEIELEEYEAINRGIQQAIGADTTPQVNAVFRLPDSHNCKVDAEGNPLPRVQAKIIAENDITYLIDDFEGVERIYQTTEGTNVLEANYAFEKVDWRKINPRLKTLLKEGTDSEEPEKKDRSTLIHRAIFGLAFAGFTDNQIFSLLTDKKNKLSEKILEKKNQKEQIRYVQMSLLKAREQITQKKAEIEAQAKEAVQTLQVLGYTENREIIFWHEGKIIPIKIKELGARDLKLLTGKSFGDELQMMINDLIEKARGKGMMTFRDG